MFLGTDIRLLVEFWWDGKDIKQKVKCHWMIGLVWQVLRFLILTNFKIYQL